MGGHLGKRWDIHANTILFTLSALTPDNIDEKSSLKGYFYRFNVPTLVHLVLVPDLKKNRTNEPGEWEEQS